MWAVVVVDVQVSDGSPSCLHLFWTPPIWTDIRELDLQLTRVSQLVGQKGNSLCTVWTKTPKHLSELYSAVAAQTGSMCHPPPPQQVWGWMGFDEMNWWVKKTLLRFICSVTRHSGTCLVMGNRGAQQTSFCYSKWGSFSECHCVAYLRFYDEVHRTLSTVYCSGTETLWYSHPCCQ